MEVGIILNLMVKYQAPALDAVFGVAR